ncbi:hypothetical protein Plhal304r1_c010g0039821 [Plasmopara halstedii]
MSTCCRSKKIFINFFIQSFFYINFKKKTFVVTSRHKFIEQLIFFYELVFLSLFYPEELQMVVHHLFYLHHHHEDDQQGFLLLHVQMVFYLTNENGPLFLI